MSEKKAISADGSQKYILQFTFPDGQKMAATKFENKFALLPVLGNTARGSILVFDTPEEVHGFVKELRLKFPAEQFEYLWKMNPRAVPITAVN